MLPFNSNNIEEFVENWNKSMPIDKWYRKKYNIPFNSPAHRQINIIDMFYEFWEFVYLKFNNKNSQNKEETYIKGEGNFMKKIELSEKEIDDIFDSIDVDEL